METANIVEFRVAKDTDVKKLASAIFSNLQNIDELKLTCIGVPSVNQAIKSIITARGYSVPTGFDIVITPSFNTVVIDQEEKTCIVLLLEKKI